MLSEDFHLAVPVQTGTSTCISWLLCTDRQGMDLSNVFTRSSHATAGAMLVRKLIVPSPDHCLLSLWSRHGHPCPTHVFFILNGVFYGMQVKERCVFVCAQAHPHTHTQLQIASLS